ncbi:unnamed protein product [Miscanthus lutarioriparius]|uniref:BED-type domain-containing protein n=1 Tax=Miscanthus lutarioriparius TaxID=422564 RepID=A0A811QR03_9POAL|nr:unnamed protein product [Miscanthus lutarioriparius]
MTIISRYSGSLAAAITWQDSENNFLRVKASYRLRSDATTLTISTSALQTSINTLGSTATVLTSANVMDENSFSNPTKVVPVKSDLSNAAEQMRVTLAPHSLSSFDLALAQYTRTIYGDADNMVIFDMICDLWLTEAMPEPEDNMDSVGTGTQFDSQETQAMVMVPMSVVEQPSLETQEQGKTKGTKKVVIDVDEKESEKTQRKELAPRSEMWQHFIKIKDDKGLLKAGRCKYCHRDIKADTRGHGTSTLKKHFGTCKRNPHVFNKDSKQGTLQACRGEAPTTWRFDQEALREAFAEMNLHKKVISFFMVKGHKGEDIGKNLTRCLADWGLDRVMTVTVDNASTNDSGVDYLRRQLQKTNIAKGKFLHMRCAAHIMNLIVRDGLQEVDLSIKRVRAAIRYIKNGTSRLVKFKEIAEEEKVDIKAFLKLDVSTRWNYTYLMLKAAIVYEKVFLKLDEDDTNYVIDLSEARDGFGHPDEDDWDNAKKMAQFLQHFHDLTIRISSSLQVTCNTFFHEIGEVHLLIQEWLNSEDNLQELWHTNSKDNDRQQQEQDRDKGRSKGREKEKKDKENINLFIFVAAFLDPRYKLSLYTKISVEEIFEWIEEYGGKGKKNEQPSVGTSKSQTPSSNNQASEL